MPYMIRWVASPFAVLCLLTICALAPKSYSARKCSKLSTGVAEGNPRFDEFRQKYGLLNPVSEIAASLGIEYKKIETREIPIHDNGAYHHVVVIRTFYTDKLALDVMTMEYRPGRSQKYIDGLKEKGLPPMRLADGTVVTQNSQLPNDIDLAQELSNTHSYAIPLPQRYALSDILRKINEEGWAEYKKLFTQILEFANKHYARRGWPAGMLNKLLRIGEKYARESTYISVRMLDPSTGKPGKMAGTLRLVHAPYVKQVRKYLNGQPPYVTIGDGGALARGRFGSPQGNVNAELEKEHPMTGWAARDIDFFNTYSFTEDPDDPIPKHIPWGTGINLVPMEETEEVSLPRPADLKFIRMDNDGWGPYELWQGEGEIGEPGTFAIDPEFNAEVFLEIASHMMVFLVDPSLSRHLSLDARAFYTYNDLPLLYEYLGMTKLEAAAYKKEWNSKYKRDMPWWLLGATPRQMLAKLKDIYKLRTRMDKERSEKMRAIILKLMRP